MVYPTQKNPQNKNIQFGQKTRGTDTNGMMPKTRRRIPVKTTLQNGQSNVNCHHKMVEKKHGFWALRSPF